MNQIIAMLLPEVLTIYTYEKSKKKKMKLKEWIIKYLIFVLFVNIINYTISIYLFKRPYFIFTNLFTLKYTVLSITIGYIISKIIVFCEKNIKIGVRIEKNEE